MSVVVDGVPALTHISLFFFLLGLAEFIFSLYTSMTTVTTITIAIAFSISGPLSHLYTPPIRSSCLAMSLLTIPLAPFYIGTFRNLWGTRHVLHRIKNTELWGLARWAVIGDAEILCRT
jgi:hypothetical protein